MLVARLWPVPFLVACGEIVVGNPDSNGTAGDAALIDAAATDGGPDAAVGPCTWTDLSKAPFANLNGPDSEESVALTGDGRTAVFTRSVGKGKPQIQEASRGSLDEPFGVPVLHDELGTDGKFEIEISSDGKELFYLSDTTPEILRAVRLNAGAPFGPGELTGVTGFSPSVSGDGLSLYFQDQGTIWRVERETVDSNVWGKVESIGSIGEFKWIDVSRDELRVLLSGGGGGEATPAMAVASRVTTAQSFGEGVSIAPELDGDPEGEYGEAAWDDSGRQIATVTNDGSFELLFAACE
jgi:hypothetical protein